MAEEFTVWCCPDCGHWSGSSYLRPEPDNPTWRPRCKIKHPVPCSRPLMEPIVLVTKEHNEALQATHAAYVRETEARLKEACEVLDAAEGESGPPTTPVTDEMVEAAARVLAVIEWNEDVVAYGWKHEPSVKEPFLRRARLALEAALPLMVPSERRVAELTTENERLRDGLMHIASGKPWGGFVSPNRIADQALQYADEARAALGESPQNEEEKQ